ncbi:MAG: ABC transporter substrate-binding protein [Candidatus Wallbacteria bacterium]|nr:ABC transporter substrate-binding protein [Candidatus Wallbacteria bacterium]
MHITYGDTICYHMDADAVDLNPLTSNDIYSEIIYRFIFNGLIGFDSNHKVIGDLAESWDISKDDLEVIFHLRQGVKWHDGTDFTASDVRFTYQKIMDPATMSKKLYNFVPVETIEVLDRSSIRVKYRFRFADRLKIWDVCIVPEHLYDNRDFSFSDHPVGTGPFRFIDWKPHEQILLEANPDFFKGRPFISRFLFKYIPDFTVAFQALRNSELDMMFLNADQYVKQADPEQFLKLYDIIRYTSYMTVLGYNMQKPVFKDRRVRLAVASAIDRESIVRDTFGGYGYVPARPFSPLYRKYDNEIRPLPFHSEYSRLLLKDAGWADTDGDGILERDGEKLRFQAIVVHGNDKRLLAAEQVKAYLAEVGIDMQLEFLELGAFMRRIYMKDFDALLTGMIMEDDPYLYLHSSQITDLSKGRMGMNLSSFSDPRMDDLLDRARQTVNEKERNSILSDFHMLFNDEQPATVLYVDETILAVSRRIRNISVASDGVFRELEKWYVPKEMQKYR